MLAAPASLNLVEATLRIISIPRIDADWAW
jgi:hypothetical protein